jgi:hypothetical protein
LRRTNVNLVLVLFLVSVAFPAAGAVIKKQTASKAPAIDPRATQLMKQMSDYLTGLTGLRCMYIPLMKLSFHQGKGLTWTDSPIYMLNVRIRSGLT